METKDRIIETAFKTFLNNGYKNCSMSDLVKATQLSKGAFYHYFENKEELYKTVIDTYFLSYYELIDWEETEQMSIFEIESMIKTYYFKFIPEIMRVTDKGMSRYFIMFFEAYNIYPKFKETVRNLYFQLKIILEKAYKLENSPNPSIKSLSLIAKYEGLIFWISVYPEENINKLINEI
ncbi:MAG: TetR/AcrR family transcriptional regulator [Saprospiraceae bacterium]